MSIETLKKATPWFIKIPAKIILSRIPIGWRAWQRLNLFRAGTMDQPEYAFGVFKKHLEATGLGSWRTRRAGTRPRQQPVDGFFFPFAGRNQNLACGQ